jgi:hypothetical protein
VHEGSVGVFSRVRSLVHSRFSRSSLMPIRTAYRDASRPRSPCDT